jgi:outer membrane protein OmpA-like peptidoglycan-associated protein
MKKLVPIALLVCLSPFCLTAQRQDAFKGVALGPTVNTPYDETMPRLSSDDSRLYFVRGKHPENSAGRGGGQDIWYSERQADGAWGPARNIGAPLNTPLHNGVGAVLDGGNTLLLNNQYASTNGTAQPGISQSRLLQGSWSNPTPVFAHPFTGSAEGSLSFHAPHADGPVVLSFVPVPGAKEDLFVLLPSPQGGWQKPKPLGSTLNTAGLETAPFLSMDGRSLYFSSDGLGGSGGADIFLSKRLDDTWTNWSDPINLGTAVNTAGFDGHFIVDAQGSNAYFVSGPTPQSLGDIYMIPLRAIPALVPPMRDGDTLRIFTKMGEPVPFSLEAFGIPNERASLVTGRSIDGQGNIAVNRNRPHFEYHPAPDFSGTETLRLNYCDPPDADECQRITVIATVEKIEIIPVPPLTIAYTTMRGMTRTDVPVIVDGPDEVLRRVNPALSKQYAKPGSGSFLLQDGVRGMKLLYTPPAGFSGLDTVPLYWDCPAGQNCRVADVIVRVYGEPVRIDTVAAPLPADILIAGKVFDVQSGKPMEAEIEFFAQPGDRPLGKIKSDPMTGYYELRLPTKENYTIGVNQQYYFPVSEAIDLGKANLKGVVTQDIPLTPMPMEVGQTFVLKDIYFDLDKSILKPESRAELQRLYNLMVQYPTMEIAIQGHTDNWASDDYNVRLSDSRANAVLTYMKFMGVMGGRMTAKGFGEAKPIATNDTDAGRALNRRVEFVITKM